MTDNPQAQQWGDKITLTNVSKMTIEHPLFKLAREQMERDLYYTISGEPRPKPHYPWYRKWRNRIELAWECLRGEITWNDIQ